MEYFSIGSGSSGNCALIGTDKTKILLDAGISGKRTKAGLNEYDLDTSDIDGIFITHEHRDHISCLGVLLRKYEIPVYATKNTISGIFEAGLGEFDRELFHVIEPKKPVLIKDLEVIPVSIKHDAADPVAYKFFDGSKSLCVMTDLGCYDGEISDFLKDSDGIVLESNHDPRMLETGIYPYHLKRRIAGDFGHLSNEDCGKLLSIVMHDNLKWIVLAHLSAENNYERLALESVKLEISMAPNKYRAGDFPIYIAPRKETGEMRNL